MQKLLLTKFPVKQYWGDICHAHQIVNNDDKKGI